MNRQVNATIQVERSQLSHFFFISDDTMEWTGEVSQFGGPPAFIEAPHPTKRNIQIVFGRSKVIFDRDGDVEAWTYTDLLGRTLYLYND